MVFDRLLGKATFGLPNEPMDDLLSLKRAVHAHSLVVLDERIQAVEASITDARGSAQSDTKSSAGDKHETGRAMAQLEIEKQQVTLGNLIAMRSTLARMDPTRLQGLVGEGALVRTDKGLLYVSVGLGRVTVEGFDVQVISGQAPLVQLLRGAAVGGRVTFNAAAHTLLAVA
jgi:hypothetical protein